MVRHGLLTSNRLTKSVELRYNGHYPRNHEPTAMHIHRAQIEMGTGGVWSRHRYRYVIRARRYRSVEIQGYVIEHKLWEEHVFPVH